MGIFKKISTSILSILSFFLLSACTENDSKETISEDTAETEILTEAEDAKEIASTQGIETLEPVLTLDKALALFYNTFEKEIINIKSIHFKKNESGNYRYFIEGWDERYHYKLKVDVGTAEIIEQEKKIADDNDAKVDLEAAITPKEAMEVALEDLDKEAVESWELKVDQHNRMIYEINFLSGRMQRVDGLTGKVL